MSRRHQPLSSATWEQHFGPGKQSEGDRNLEAHRARRSKMRSAGARLAGASEEATGRREGPSNLRMSLRAQGFKI